jgi:hypothetical protein
VGEIRETKEGDSVKALSEPGANTQMARTQNLTKLIMETFLTGCSHCNQRNLC